MQVSVGASEKKQAVLPQPEPDIIAPHTRIMFASTAEASGTMIGKQIAADPQKHPVANPRAATTMNVSSGMSSGVITLATFSITYVAIPSLSLATCSVNAKVTIITGISMS